MTTRFHRFADLHADVNRIADFRGLGELASIEGHAPVALDLEELAERELRETCREFRLRVTGREGGDEPAGTHLDAVDAHAGGTDEPGRDRLRRRLRDLLGDGR